MLKRRTFKHHVLSVGAILVLAIYAIPVNAQAIKPNLKTKPKEKVPPKEVPRMTPTVLEEKIQEVRERIKIAEAEENEQTAAKKGVTLSHLQERTAKLKEIEAVYQRLLTAFKKQEALEKEKAFLGEQLKTQRGIGLSKEPPYSLSFYDTLLDQLNAAETQRETVAMAVKLAERTLADSRLRLEKEQKTIRSLMEKSEGGDPSKIFPGLRLDLERAQLDESLARGTFDFQELNYANLLKEKELTVLRTRAARHNIDWVRSHLQFDDSDLERQLSGIEQRRSELQKRLDRLIEEKSEVEHAWLEAQKLVESARDEADVDFAKVKLKEREAWRETYQNVLEQTEDMLQLLNQQDQTWKNRYALIRGGVSAKQLEAWREDTENQIRNTHRIIQLQQNGLANLQANIAALENQLAGPDLNPKIKPLLENRLQAFHKAVERTLEYLSALLGTDQMHRRLLDEISAIAERTPVKERIQNAAEKLRKIWNFEILVIDDKAVTMKKITVAFIILVIGILALKFILRLLRKRILPHTQIKVTTAAAIEKLLYYFALSFLILFALRMVNIPLTVFAFLGGAIAIGLGFGAQNLINNFISGFIIMGERPIKIGDLVEVDGNFAMIEEIGARCTRIRTGANVHILVPNSSFLEKNIINWTLSDQMVRTNVTVGVVYGSPVQEVRRLLLQAVSEKDKVIKKSPPFVLFNDFGDNALIFDVYFWIHMTKPLDRLLIESDVRFRIDELFREAGIVIAFPQRDVHFDTQRPLELRIVGQSAPHFSEKDQR